MKFHKYKTVARLHFSGADDLLRLNTASLTYDFNKATKTFKFKIDTNNIKLSKNSKIVLEHVAIPNIVAVNNLNHEIFSKTYERVELRCKNLSSSQYLDSTYGNNYNPILFSDVLKSHINSLINPDYDPANIVLNPIIINEFNKDLNISFYNPSPKMLYNFDCPTNFLNNGVFEFELKYVISILLDVVTDAVSFDNLQISLIVYDIDEEELLSKDTEEQNWKLMKPLFPNKKII